MGQLLAKQDTETNALLYKCDECRNMFMSKIMRDDHRIRMHNQTINVLPAELFENILDFLHPNDLVNVSQTCYSYKEWIADYFVRKRQCGWVKIRIKDKRPNFDFSGKQKYEIYFRSIIRNVEIKQFFGHSSKQLFQFAKKNCTKNIRCFAFEGFGLYEKDESDLKIIWDQIKTVEILALYFGETEYPSTDRSSMFYIEHSDIYFANDPRGERMWMSKTFQKLHTFHLSSLYTDPDDLSTFFQNNRQIETFSCFDLKAIQSIVLSKIHLSHLVYRPFYEKNKGETIKKIEKCYDQIDILDVEASWIADTDKFAQMEKVKRLNCELCISLHDIQYPHVQQLCADCCHKRIVKNFPNLTKLLIVAPLRYPTLNEFVSNIVDGLPKLKHLYLKLGNDSFKIGNINLNEWNSIRMKDDPALSIHLYGKYLDDFVPIRTNGFSLKPDYNRVFDFTWNQVDVTIILKYLEDLRYTYPVTKSR